MKRIWIAIGLVIGCNEDAAVRDDRAQPRPKQNLLAETTRPTPSRRDVDEPKPQAIDLKLGNGIEMRRPITDGRLAVIPIVATFEAPKQTYITLQDGMARGMVVVREIAEDGEEFTVDRVRVSNNANEPLAIISGEVIIEAHQDRVTAEQVVIAPHQSRTVSVRCVEQDRSEGGYVFKPSHALAELSLRRTVVHQDQEDVWQRVAAINRRDHVTSATSSYRNAAKKLLTDASRTARRDKITKQLESLEERDHMIGLAVAIDGVPLALERFSTPELYRQFEARLIASYLPETDGVAQKEVRQLTPDMVRKFSTGAANSTQASHTLLAR